MISPNGAGVGRTVALVYNTDTYLHRLRGDLIRALAADGYNVYAIAPEGSSVSAIEADGATFVHWSLPRRGLNPVVEMLSIWRLWRIYRRIGPDIAHHFTAKPNIYGAVAGRLAGVPVTISSVNGLGYVFTGDDRTSALVRPLVTASITWFIPPHQFGSRTISKKVLPIVATRSCLSLMILKAPKCLLAYFLIGRFSIFSKLIFTSFGNPALM